MVSKTKENFFRKHETPINNVLALFILGCFLALLYFVTSHQGVTQQSQSQSTQQVNTIPPTMNPSPSIQPIDMDTSQWKTFINAQYGYSIKYPQQQAIIDPLDMTENPKNMYSVEVGVPNAPVDNYPLLYIDVIPQSGILPATYNGDSFMQNLRQYIYTINIGQSVVPTDQPFGVRYTRKNNISIANSTGYVFTGSLFNEKRVVIVRNGFLYVIGGYNRGALFDQILSTFHFTQ